MQKIQTFLWFNDNAEEAVNFYISVFKNAKIAGVSRYGDTGPGPKGSIMTIAFQLEGQDFIALNGGPNFTFTQAISLVVNCETQDELDMFWEKLASGGGKTHVCGWLKDRFGLSWQVVPAIIGSLVSDKDPAKSNRVMKAIMQMTKLDIAKLKQAAEGA